MTSTATPTDRYRLVPPGGHGAYAFGIEDVRPIAEPLADLMRAFAYESSRRLRWNPPSALAIVEQQNRGYLTVTVRRDEALVGFCVAHRVRDGAADAGMYLLPAHRAGWTAVRLTQYVQGAMRALGAQWMTWETDEGSGSHLIPKYLGHELITRRYLVALTQGDPA